MTRVIQALLAAAKSLVHPIILAVLLVPMLIALTLWLGLAWVFWDGWKALVQGAVVDWTATSWTANWDMARLGAIAAWIGAFLVLAPAVMATSLLIATLFAMPVLVGHIARLDFPVLERRRGGTLGGSIWNAFAAIGLFGVFWIVTLPLWLLGPLAVIVPLLLSAQLNQRLFRYDALSEHASAAEMTRIFAEAKGRLFLLGLVTGLLYFIPPFNLIAPVFAALAFIHLCLEELRQLRAEEIPVSGEVVSMRQYRD